MKITFYASTNEVLSELGRRIKAARIALPATQKEMAEMTNLSQKTISNLETGKDVSFSTVVEVLRALGLLQSLGKSTFWNVLSRVLGSYSGNISADALTVGCKRNVKPELAETKGKRLLIAAELEEGMRLNTSLVKQFCSTDEIFAEKKYKDPFGSHTTWEEGKSQLSAYRAAPALPGVRQPASFPGTGDCWEEQRSPHRPW